MNNDLSNLQNLFEQTPEMFCILSGSEHRFDYVNLAHIKALGFDATGKTVREAQPESVEVYGILDHVYCTGETAHLHEIPVTVGNRLRYFNLTYAAKRDIAGKIDGILIIGIEVTEQVESRAHLERAKLELQELFDQAPAPMVLLSGPELRFTMVNPLYEKLVKRNVLGKTLYEAFSEPEARSTLKHIENVYQTGEPFFIKELEIALPDDKGVLKTYFLNVSYTAIKSSNQLIKGVAAIVVDVTEQVISREHLRLGQVHLQQAIQARDRFLSIASHELKTPLTALKIQLQMFGRMFETKGTSELTLEKVSKVIGNLDQGLNRLTRLVEDMVDISRIQMGKLSLRKEEVDLGALLSEVMERLGPELSRAGVKCHCEFPSGIFASIDQFRLEQVVTNLVTNVIRYAAHAPLSVKISQDHGQALITFQDSGPGIAPADREKIFQRFERLESNRDISGMGLGLFISRQIIEGHGGSIKVIDSKEGGAMFVITLPLK